MSDLQLQQYLFDVQGYLVIENVLSPDELAALNERIDAQQLPTPGKVQRFGSAPDGSGFLQWGKPFCNLLDHPKIMPILQFRLGDCFRLDRIYGMYMEEGMPRGWITRRLRCHIADSKSEPWRILPFPRQRDSQRIRRCNMEPRRYRTGTRRILLHPGKP